MDAAVVLLGALAGFVASLVPGFHVNTLAAFALVAAPAAGHHGALFLVAAFAAGPFGAALASPFLGATGDDDALQALPAQALAREGRAGEAVALQAWGSLAGVLVALPLAGVAWLALRPLEPRLGQAMPWLLLLVVALLVLTERARPAVHRRWLALPEGVPGGTRVPRHRVLDPHGILDPNDPRPRAEACWTQGPLSPLAGRLSALLVLALSGALGLAAFRLGARSPFGVPASPLLPLLAGLFAVPALLGLMQARRARGVRMRAPWPARGELARAALPGAAAGMLLGLVPGVSASHAGLLLPRARTPEHALMRLAALQGGAVVFTLLAWHALGKARAGALVAAQAMAPPAPWRVGLPPVDVLQEAAMVVLAALAAFGLARGLAAPAGRFAVRWPPARLAAGGLVVLCLCVAAFQGLPGLLVLGASGLVGLLPPRLGVRRSHAMGVILFPALLRAWGLT